MIKKFKCPFCNKAIEVKEDDKYIYHRPWQFHFAIDHKKLFTAKKIKREEVPLWLYYPWLDEKTQKELRDGLKKI